MDALIRINIMKYEEKEYYNNDVKDDYIVATVSEAYLTDEFNILV